MKVKFKYSPGQMVTTKTGLTGRITISGVTDEGNQYLVRGVYSEQWTPEAEIKTSSPAPQEEDAE